MLRRVVRADSPSDVVSATLVLRSLEPGEDHLVVSADKSVGDPRAYRACLASLAELHTWAGVIDVSSSVMAHHLAEEARGVRARLQRSRDLRSYTGILRERLAQSICNDPAASLEGIVDELYVACVNHPDVQALYRVLPDATKILYPHTLISLMESERQVYEPFCVKDGNERHSMLDRAKALIWGWDAVPVRGCRVDRAFSFDYPFESATENISCRGLLDRGVLQRLFDKLPARVSGYYRHLQRAAGAHPGLLLLIAPLGTKNELASPDELDAYVQMVRRMITDAAPTSIIVKPHSLSSEARNRQCVAYLSTQFPEVPFVSVERYFEYPAELAFSSINFVACGGLGTTALRSFEFLFGIKSYCAETHLRRIVKGIPSLERSMDLWIDEFAAHYVAV